MHEFLGSIHFNKNGDLLLSSSYLTYQKWTGFIGLISKQNLVSTIEAAKHFSQPISLSCLKTGQTFSCGLADAKWTSNQNVLIGKDNGEISLLKIVSTDNENDIVYELKMSKAEHDSMVMCVETKHDDHIALSGSFDSSIKIWDLNEEISIRTLKGHNDAISSVTLNPNDAQSNVFLSSSQDNRTLLWDTRKEKPAFLINTSNLNGYVLCTSWSQLNANMIALGSETGLLGIYDLRQLKSNSNINTNQAHKTCINKCSFHPNKSNLIATVSQDCRTKVFTIEESQFNISKEIYSNDEHKDYITDLAWLQQSNSNTNGYLTCSWDGCIKTHALNNINDL